MDKFAIEIIQKIFKYLNPIDLRKNSLVCKQFYYSSKYFIENEKWEKILTKKKNNEEVSFLTIKDINYTYNIEKINNYFNKGLRYIMYRGDIKLIINVVTLGYKSHHERMYSLIVKEGLINLCELTNKPDIYLLVESKNIKARGISMSRYE